MKKAAVFLITCLFAMPLQAGVLTLDYKSFYSHVRKLDNDELSALQFSFGLQNAVTAEACHVRDAKINTQKQQIPLQVDAQHRFTIPKERALRLADATVVLEIDGSEKQCDMSVQLETKPEYLKRDYSKKELKLILNQYTMFFQDMGGFFSYMMPSVTGLVFQFDDRLNHGLPNELNISNGRLEIDESKISAIIGLRLPQEPLRITALTQSS